MSHKKSPGAKLDLQPAVTADAYTDEAHAIHARDMDFNWDDVPLHYIPGELVATHVYNVMHLLLPEGEKAMSAALAAALPLIDEPRLHEEAVGFIGQETTHADNHGDVLEHLVGLGLNPTPVLDRLDRFIGLLMGDWGSQRVRHRLLCERLALFSALEHFTALWGKFFLESEGLRDSGIHPMVYDLLRWHGAEEVEHRSVVFDVYQYIDGSHGRRVRMGIVGSIALSFAGFMALGYLIVNDPVRRATRSRFKRVLGPFADLVRITRAGIIPSPLAFLTELPTYVRRDFHPSSLGGMDLAVRYLATAPIRQHTTGGSTPDQGSGHDLGEQASA